MVDTCSYWLVVAPGRSSLQLYLVGRRICPSAAFRGSSARSALFLPRRSDPSLCRRRSSAPGRRGSGVPFRTAGGPLRLHSSAFAAASSRLLPVVLYPVRSGYLMQQKTPLAPDSRRQAGFHRNLSIPTPFFHYMRRRRPLTFHLTAVNCRKRKEPMKASAPSVSPSF
jgi:hypothetical protein